MKYRILFLILSFILNACVDTHKDMFVSKVRISDLKGKLIKQKCHNQAIFIFDPSCPICMHYLSEQYLLMQDKFLDSIDYIFISTDTLHHVDYKKYFSTIGVKAGSLFFIDENNFSYLKIDEKIKILKEILFIFSNKDNIVIQGFPISLMADKDNRIKLECFSVDDTTSIIRPKPWHELCELNISEIDFNEIDNCN
jgi:hypothetical protein